MEKFHNNIEIIEECLFKYYNGPTVRDKVNELTYLILNAKREENKIPMLKMFDNIILPFKDMNFCFDKVNKTLFIHTIYGHIEGLDWPGKMFKYIYTTIHLKMMDKYEVVSIANVIVDVMIYCIVNNVEVSLINLISLDWIGLLKDKSKFDEKWIDTKNNFKEAMSDGYMKDVILKAIEQEEETQYIRYSYSIVDIVNQLK